MKRIVRWTAGTVLGVALLGFLAFLYFIPPFLTASPETFSRPMASAAPDTRDIADPVTRVIAERGRAIVTRSGCIGCHATNGSQGPDLAKYLAGGALKFQSRDGIFISRNLTPDAETGLAKRTDEEVKRVLRSGVSPDGHVVSSTIMPWGGFSNWTEEDRHAVVVYLRHLPAIRHQIPDPDPTQPLVIPGVIEQGFAGRDYGVTPAVPVGRPATSN